MNAKSDSYKFKNNEPKINKDIYFYAFAAIMHPMECEDKSGYMPRITLMSDERMHLFINALLVASVQTAVIYLIVYHFEEGEMGLGVQLVPSDQYSVMVMRFIASAMMHLNVQGDIR